MLRKASVVGFSTAACCVPLGWFRSGITALAIVICVSFLNLGYSDAGEKPSTPRRIVVGHSLAKDEMPLRVSVEGGGNAQIYRLFNSNYKVERWIGQAPQ